MLRRFALEHTYVAYILALIILVAVSLLFYRIAKADNSHAMQSDNIIYIDQDVPVYVATYRNGNYLSNTTYYATAYLRPVTTGYSNYDYSNNYYGSVRSHGAPAWGSGSNYNNYTNTSYNTYSAPVRPHGPPAW